MNTHSQPRRETDDALYGLDLLGLGAEAQYLNVFAFDVSDSVDWTDVPVSPTVPAGDRNGRGGDTL